MTDSGAYRCDICSAVMILIPGEGRFCPNGCYSKEAEAWDEVCDVLAHL
jgi:hypothetical protein